MVCFSWRLCIGAAYSFVLFTYAGNHQLRYLHSPLFAHHKLAAFLPPPSLPDARYPTTINQSPPCLQNSLSLSLSSVNVTYDYEQIKEEFSNGVSPGHQPSSSSAAGAAAAAAPSRGADDPAVPRWPFQAAGVSRPRRAVAASPPGLMARGRDDNNNNNAGRAIGGGAGGRDAQAGGARDGRKREAEEADELRRAEALARKKREVRGE